MDKKLIAAFTFGILAVSVANLLLSVGIVSLLFSESRETGSILTDTGNIPWGGATYMNTLSLEDTNNTTMGFNTSISDIPGANATITPLPSTGQLPATGLPANGQLPQDRGQAPPAGQMPVSGQMPPASGQMPAAGQYPAGSGQASQASQLSSDSSLTPSGPGKYLTDTGANQDSVMSSVAGTGMIPVDINELFGSLPGSTSQATATPTTSSTFFNNFNSMLANQ
jgi:hypothetical protein